MVSAIIAIAKTTEMAEVLKDIAADFGRSSHPLWADCNPVFRDDQTGGSIRFDLPEDPKVHSAASFCLEEMFGFGNGVDKFDPDSGEQVREFVLG